MRVTFDAHHGLVALSQLKKSTHQRNKHPDEQIQRLAKIMREHGVRHPIHVSKLSGEVCFGHGRWAAAKLNGWTEYPVVYQDFSSDLEEYACVQSDNAIAAWSELDLDSIKSDLPSFGDDLDIELLGLKSLDVALPDFAPGTEDDQGQLDQKQFVFMECPHCKEKFEKGQARVIEN